MMGETWYAGDKASLGRLVQETLLTTVLISEPLNPKP